MPAERTTMRHVREVLRLKFVPTGEIARRIGVAASTVRATIKRFQAAGPACQQIRPSGAQFFNASG
jgi:Mn-dependent DtxR family transcriptional regulator